MFLNISQNSQEKTSAGFSFWIKLQADIFKNTFFHNFFFLSGFSFIDTDDSQDRRGREGTIFYFTLPLPPAHKAAARWDLLPYRITIWLIDDVTLVFFVCLRDDLILAFLLQQFETRKRWTRTLIDYHPCITSGPTNQVC